MMNHDPPIFVIGYSGGLDNAKDSLRNIMESGECTIPDIFVLIKVDGNAYKQL